MHELDRIEQALATRRLDHNLFERCAQDLLIETYPGLTPIPGGTDWGRDADIHGIGTEIPTRLLATASRTLEGVRKNMLRGIVSMEQHGILLPRGGERSLTQFTIGDSSQVVSAVMAIGDHGFLAFRLTPSLSLGYQQTWRKAHGLRFRSSAMTGSYKRSLWHNAIS